MKLSRRPLPLLLGAAGIASAAAIAIGGAQIAGNTSASDVRHRPEHHPGDQPVCRRVRDAGPAAPGAPSPTQTDDAEQRAAGRPRPRPTARPRPAATTEATASQLVGVVDIVTTVNYDQGEAAGTGMVLTSSGEVLTNNHVVEGATSIKVTVLSTGRTYAATVVGTSPTNDVAVLQLSGASGLATVGPG